MFVSDITGPPFDIEVCDRTDEPGFLVAIPIAHDDQHRVVFVETLLSPVEIDGFEHHEVVFQISVVSLDGSQEDVTTQMRETARQYLPAETVPFIMTIVAESCTNLVNHCNPSLIYYVTKETHLPEKALLKYNILTEALQSCGYAIYELGVDAAGRAFWKLTAPQSNEPVAVND